MGKCWDCRYVEDVSNRDTTWSQCGCKESLVYGKSLMTHDKVGGIIDLGCNKFGKKFQVSKHTEELVLKSGKINGFDVVMFYVSVLDKWIIEYWNDDEDSPAEITYWCGEDEPNEGIVKELIEDDRKGFVE